MFYLPPWTLNFNPTAIDLSSTSSSSEPKVDPRSNDSSSAVDQPTPSAFANYKNAVSETATTTTSSSSLSSTEAPATTGLGALQSQIQMLPSSLFENASTAAEKRLWQNLLAPDVLSAVAASAATVGEVHRRPSSLVVGAPWNQALINSSYETRLVDLKLDTAASMQRSRAVGARESTGTLKAWLCQHLKNPYPSKGEKIMLAIVTRMTLTQVSTWFANARRRLKKERSIRWRVDGDDDDDDDDDKDDDNYDDDDDDNFADCEDYNDDDYENECDENDEYHVEKENGTPESKRKYPSDRLPCPCFKKQRLRLKVNPKTRADHSATKDTSSGTVSASSFIRDRRPDDRSPSPPTPVAWILRQSTSSSPSGGHDDVIVCRHSSDSNDGGDDALRSPCSSPSSLPPPVVVVGTRSETDAERGGTTSAIDLSRSSCGGGGKSVSSAVASSTPSASKPRIWSIVELATA